MFYLIILILIGFPLLVALLMFYLNRKKSRFRKIFIPICAFAVAEIVLLVIFTLLLFLLFKDFNFGERDQSTQPSEYMAYLTRYSTPYHVKHFPKKIPQEAESYSISYRPSFLQGDERNRIELRFTQPYFR